MEVDESRGLFSDARPARSRRLCFAVLTGVVVLCARASTSPSGEESASRRPRGVIVGRAGVVLERWTHVRARGRDGLHSRPDATRHGRTASSTPSHRPLSDSTGAAGWTAASRRRACQRLALALALPNQANTAYAVEGRARRGDASSPALLATETFVSAATGRGFVDDERFGIPLGPKRSKWELLSLAHATAHNDGRDEWSGLVVVDTDGDVVWHVGLDLGKGFVSWDRVHAGENGNASWAVLRLRNSYGDMCSLAQPSNCSALLTLDQVGRVTTTYEQRCEGDVLGYNSLHHECLHVGGTKVLSLAASAQYLPGLPIDYDQYHEIEPTTSSVTRLSSRTLPSSLRPLTSWTTVLTSEVTLVSQHFVRVLNAFDRVRGRRRAHEQWRRGGAQRYEAISVHARPAAPAKHRRFPRALRNL